MTKIERMGAWLARLANHVQGRSRYPWCQVPASKAEVWQLAEYLSSTEELKNIPVEKSKMAKCRLCNDLDVDNLNLGFETLRKGVQIGCSACSMLLQGVTHFVLPDDISELRIFVDYALYVEIIRREKGERFFVEFSTSQGVRSCIYLIQFSLILPIVPF